MYNLIEIKILSCISVVTIVLMLMHVGCRTMKCGSTNSKCWNYDGTCDGGRILDLIEIKNLYCFVCVYWCLWCLCVCVCVCDCVCVCVCVCDCVCDFSV